VPTTVSGGTGGGELSTKITELFDIPNALVNTFEYIPSLNKLYVASGGNNVLIFDATSGELLSTVLVTAALKLKYIAIVDEVWCTSSTQATITRISPSTNTSLGTITGLAASIFDLLEYSSTKVFATVTSSSPSILVINPSTFAVTTITTGVPQFVSGMVLNNNPSSAQFDKIILTASGGVAILDPNTNSISTTLVNPSSSISTGRKILYSQVDDKYYIASQLNHRVVCLNIDSATTFSVDKIKYNAFQIMDLEIDESNDLLIINQVGAITINLNTMCHFIKKSTFESMTNINTPSLGGGNSQAGYLKLDTVNRRVFIAGRGSSRSIVTVKYL
jgi:hypothetical protein